MCYGRKISVKLDYSQSLLVESLVNNYCQLVIQIIKFNNSCMKSIFILINYIFK